MIYVLSGNPSLYAVIAVTYPAGSICTCGGKSAKDTSGYALFNVKAGTYTVECHTSDGSKSKSTSVTVAEGDKGQVKTVTLAYELYLFKAGTGSNTEWTTGGGTYGSEWTTSSTDYLVGYIGGDPNGYCVTAYLYANSAIDVTDYKTLVVTVHGDSGQEFGLSDSKGGSLVVSKSLGRESSERTLTIDISSISGDKYFVIVGNTSSYVKNLTCYITNIYVK